MNTVKLLAGGALALLAGSSVAWAQAVPQGRVYSFHSTAQGGCPALDWHVVVGAGGSLSGMIAWDDMKAMARATGTVKDGKVHMTATEVGGQGRTAQVDGTIGSNGYFTVNVKAPNVDCKGINVPYFVPAAGGGG